MTQARTPEEKVSELLTLRAKVEAQIKATLRQINNQPAKKRSRHIVPECGSESAWQRHRHLGDTADDKRRVNCEPCRAAHSLHNRIQYARRTYGEAS